MQQDSEENKQEAVKVEEDSKKEKKPIKEEIKKVSNMIFRIVAEI